ncbi:MAG: pilin [Candidatus Saccharimonadales bacterium]
MSRWEALISLAASYAKPSNLPSTSLNGSTVDNVFNGAIVLAGALSVVFVIVGGIRYVLSNGDTSQAATAKNTILYAVIGLVIAMSAFVIMRFVTGRLFG